MLDTSLGRWMQEDPKLFEAGDSNLNRFVHNNATNFTDPSGLDEKEELERKNLQRIFGVPAATDAPTVAKIYSEKDAPVGLSFADGGLWRAVRGQMSGKPFVDDLDKRKNVARENAAAKAMMGWRDLKGLDLHIYYIGNSAQGPEMFLKDAVTKGSGSVNIFFGHGSGDMRFEVGAALQKVPPAGKAAAPLFGLACCYAKYYNDKVPEKSRIPNVPTNAKEIMVGDGLVENTPMLEAVDKIIRDRLKNKEKLQVNIYFGEMSMNGFSLDPKTGQFKEWDPHPNRFREWKWAD